MLGSTKSATVAWQHLGRMLGLTKSAVARQHLSPLLGPTQSTAVVGQHLSWMLGPHKSAIALQHLVRFGESGTERISYDYATPKMMGLSEIRHRSATPRSHAGTNRTFLARHTLAVLTVIKFTVARQHLSLLWLIKYAVARQP